MEDTSVNVSSYDGYAFPPGSAAFSCKEEMLGEKYVVSPACGPLRDSWWDTVGTKMLH